MVNQTIIPENFSHCSTNDQCAEYMKKNNMLNPIGYFELALRKVYNLSQEQKIDLQDKSNCHRLTIITSKTLSEHLTPKQILYLKQRTEKG